jgi:hypothetical protein
MGDRTLFDEASEAMCPAEGMSVVESLDPAILQATRRAQTETARYSESLKTPDEPEEWGNYYKSTLYSSLVERFLPTAARKQTGMWFQHFEDVQKPDLVGWYDYPWPGPAPAGNEPWDMQVESKVTHIKKDGTAPTCAGGAYNEARLTGPYIVIVRSEDFQSAAIFSFNSHPDMWTPPTEKMLREGKSHAATLKFTQLARVCHEKQVVIRAIHGSINSYGQVWTATL